MTGIPEWYFYLSVGLFGLLFGSLANVIIWRVPRGESIVSPGSHCPVCDTSITWYDNIPVVSYLFLRGRCRTCGARISYRYPVVEILSGILWVGAAVSFGITAQTAAAVFLFYLLLILAAIDIDTRRLPNVLVLTLASVGAIGVLVSEIFGVALLPLRGVAESGVLSHPIAAALLGVVLGAGLTAGIGFTYQVVRHRRGMGMGDIKLLGALGVFLGPYVLVALFIASIVGAVTGVCTLRGRNAITREIPFGPFLAFGAIIAAIWGPIILHGYASLIGIR